MKPIRYLVAGAYAVTTILLAGCAASGVATRIQEKSAAFNQLNAATQKHVEGGNVEQGYTADMVYIALGKPTKIETRESSDGPVEVWIYKNISVPTSTGFRGIRYNPDHAGISPGFNPSKSIRSQLAAAARSSTDQQFNYLNDDAMAAAAEIPDLPFGTLYVFFFQGRVYKLNLDPNSV